MHFVLGCNLSELAGSLKHVYGQELNANEYLQKFIHINITLPISEKQGNDDREKYINYLLRKSRLSISAELSSSLFGEVARIAKSTKLSFRDIDRVCSYCVLSAAYAPKNLYTQDILLAGLCVLRVKHPELFEKARSGDLSVKDVQSALGMYLINQDYVSAEERRAYELWEWVCVEGQRKSNNNFEGWTTRFNLGRADILPFLSKSIADAFIIFERP